MTGNPQLTERQQTLLRQINNCRTTAKAVRESNHYNQDDCGHCLIAHAEILGIVPGFGKDGTGNQDLEAFGLLGKSWAAYFGLTEDVTSHDGTPTGAAAWLEQHALELEAQV